MKVNTLRASGVFGELLKGAIILRVSDVSLLAAGFIAILLDARRPVSKGALVG